MCVDMEVESKALEVPCRRGDVEVWSPGALEACRLYRMELGSLGGRLRACRCGGMELGSSGGAI